MLCCALLHLEDLYFQSADKVLQESKLLRVWRLRVFLDAAKHVVEAFADIRAMPRGISVALLMKGCCP